jgi:hypothetical protein
MAEVLCKLYANEPTESRCRCGAPKRIVHCPACASTNFYGKQCAGLELPMSLEEYVGADMAAVKTPTMKLRGFHCRRCEVDFYEGQPCEAPFFESETMKKRREMDEARAKTTALFDDEFKLALLRGESKEEARRSALKVLLKVTAGV